MMNASFTGKAALMAQQQRLDVLGNNISNVNTYGFRASMVHFKDTLYSQMNKPAGDTTVNLQRGSGIRVSATDLNMIQGNILATGNLMDFAIEGDGFFAVQNPNGQTMYTRAGVFERSSEADGNYLVTSQGYYVLDTNGNRISIPNGDQSTLSVSADGTMRMGQNPPFAQLQVVTFANPYALYSAGGSLFSATNNSGGPQAATGAVVQGSLEGSNADLMTQFTTMIRTQRSFSLAGRCVTTADDMDGLANNLRG